MSNYSFRSFLMASVFIVPVSTYQLATAQESATDEIIVTGQKRAENLQEVAVAATVLAGSNLENLGIESLSDLQNSVVGLSITGGGLTQSVNIRGVGLSSGSPSAANGVASYIDGVFQPPIVTTSSFYDIASVEVFRGPQGTFVGSNSTGGAIFINSQNPELGETGGYIQGEVGNYSRMGLEGAVNIPLTDTLAVRAAGIFRERDSFYTRTDGTEPPASLEEYAGRLGVYWEPTDNFSATIKAEKADKKTGGYASRPRLGTRYAPFRSNDPFTLNYSDPTRNDETSEQLSVKLEYETDGGFIFRTISAYQDKQISNLYDQDGTSSATLPRSTQDQFVREEVYTGEFNILSPEDKRFRWIAGGYYQENQILVDISNNPTSPVHVDIDIQNTKTTTGFFGQVTYDLTDKLSMDIGTRYSTYDIVGAGAVNLVTPGPTIFLADPGGEYDDGQWTGKFALNYQATPDHLFYGFVAKGYKSGGFASRTSSFDPETVIDYEFGWKGTLADGLVTTQVGAFYYDYEGFQLDAIDQVTGRSSLINIADATVKGVEAQMQANLGNLYLTAGAAYTDSSLSGTEFIDTRAFAAAFPGVSNAPQCPVGTASTPPTCVDYTPFISTTDGGPNLYSPKFSANVAAKYIMPMDGWDLISHINYGYVGKRFTYIGYNPERDVLEGRGLVNGALTFDLERFDFELFGTNIFGKDYVSSHDNSNESYGSPTEYGVRLRMDF